MKLAETIVPKSDQLNADDLLTGPRTITITDVDLVSGDQPLHVHYEGENGRPWKPSKSMRRVMIGMWGDESTNWIGQSVTVFCDPSVRLRGQEVGGIRISHATGIDREFVILLTVTRAKREPYKVNPLTYEVNPLKVEKAKAPAPPAAETHDIALLQDVGRSKAEQGTALLREWYSNLDKAAKLAVKPTLDAEWKDIAEGADAEKGGEQ